MNNSKQYKGSNKNSGPTRYGNHKAEGTPPAATAAKPEIAEVDAPAVTDAQAAVAITSIEARGEPKADPNVVMPAKAPAHVAPAIDARPLASAEAKVDALDNVKSGAQILADTARPAESTLPKS